MPGENAARARGSDVTYVLALLLGSRLVLEIIGVLARTYLLPLRDIGYAWDYPASPWLAIWGQWDSRWYMDIATSGYSAQLHTEPELWQQANYRFFPLYPLLMRWLGPLFGGPFGAGIAISNVALFASCLLLIRLARLDYDEDTARRAARYLVLMPTAFILSGVYSESLFLAFTLASFYLLRTERYAAAAVFAFLAALTRHVGFLLLLPLAIQAWQQRKSVHLEPRMAWLLLIPLAPALFAAFNYTLTGNPLAFVEINSAWSSGWRNPIEVLAMALFYVPEWELRFFAVLTLAALLLLALHASRIALSYLVMGAAYLGLTLSTAVLSMPRHLLPVFALPIALAQVSSRRPADVVLTAGLAILQCLLMPFWACGFKFIV